jgi:PKD repeat protein
LIALLIFGSICVSAEDSQLLINPSNQSVNTSEAFSITVNCIPSIPIKGYELEIIFDSSLIKVNSVSEGNIFNSFPTFFNSGNIDNSEGIISNIYGLILGLGNTSISGTLCSINFSSKVDYGNSFIQFNRVGEWTGIVNETGYLPISVVDGSVTIVEEYVPPGEPPEEPPEEPPIEPPQEPPEEPPIEPPQEPPIEPPEEPPEEPPIEPPQEPPEESPQEPPSSYDGEPQDEDENNPPAIPLKPSGPTFIELGVEYAFESSSFDIDGDDLRIKFDWGDGNFSDWSEPISSNSTTGFTYYWNDISSYFVRAISQDSYGLNSSWSQPLIITVSEVDNGEPPYPNFKLIGKIVANELIIFDASDSIDSDGTIVNYQWDFGDGENAMGAMPEHSYDEPGNYVITLIVTDNNGNNYSKSVSINVPDISSEISDIDKSESQTGVLIAFNNIIIIIIIITIIVLISLIFIFGRKIQNFVSSIHIPSISKIMEINQQRKIDNINNKIDKLCKKIDYNDNFYEPEKIEMNKNIDLIANKNNSSSMFNQNPRLFDKENTYDSKLYDYNSGDSFDKLVIDNLSSDSFINKNEIKIVEEPDIDKVVDKILVSRMIDENFKYSDSKREFVFDENIRNKMFD